MTTVGFHCPYCEGPTLVEDARPGTWHDCHSCGLLYTIERIDGHPVARRKESDR